MAAELAVVTAAPPTEAADGAPPVVRAQGLSIVFDSASQRTTALQDVTLDIARGSFVSLIGPSGCGKTTLLRAIADLERPTAGTLVVNGMTPERARLARAYGYVFQAPALYPWRTVERNVMLPLEIMGLKPEERRERAQRATSTSSASASSGGGFPGSFPAACSNAPRSRAH